MRTSAFPTLECVWLHCCSTSLARDLASSGGWCGRLGGCGSRAAVVIGGASLPGSYRVGHLPTSRACIGRYGTMHAPRNISCEPALSQFSDGRGPVAVAPLWREKPRWVSCGANRVVRSAQHAGLWGRNIVVEGAGWGATARCSADEVVG